MVAAQYRDAAKLLKHMLIFVDVLQSLGALTSAEAIKADALGHPKACKRFEHHRAGPSGCANERRETLRQNATVAIVQPFPLLAHIDVIPTSLKHASGATDISLTLPTSMKHTRSVKIDNDPAFDDDLKATTKENTLLLF